jgi:predicted transcriptional regulator
MAKVRTDGDALDVHEITSEEVSRRLGVQLRKMIGPGRRWSYKGVAHLTGIDERSLKAYAAGTACPNLAKFKRLLAVLGPELGRDIDRMYGWMPRVEAHAPGTLDLLAFRADLLERLRLIDAQLLDAQQRAAEAPSP